MFWHPELPMLLVRTKRRSVYKTGASDRNVIDCFSPIAEQRVDSRFGVIEENVV